MNEQTDSGVAVNEPSTEEWSNRLGRTGRDRDFLYVAKTAKTFNGQAENLAWNRSIQALQMPARARETVKIKGSGDPYARYTSPVIQTKFPSIEFLPSWNIGVSPEAGFKVYLRVQDKQDRVSPWFFVGEGGSDTAEINGVILDEEWGKVHIDYLELKRAATAFQYQVIFSAPDNVSDELAAEIHHVTIHYSGQMHRNRRRTNTGRITELSVPVPYRSQLDVEDEEMRHIVCSPTCLAMVMESLGVNHPTVDVCKAVFDPRHQLYGLWPRSAQAAFQFGLRAWVQRFRHLDDVRACLASGRPVIASIRVKEGELRGARYPKSNGHIIVIRGFTESGKVLVNDPYSAGSGGAEIEYESPDIEKVWLDRGGVAILIEKPKSQ